MGDSMYAQRRAENVILAFITLPHPIQNMALYADVSGKQFPVTRGQDVGRYQVRYPGLLGKWFKAGLENKDLSTAHGGIVPALAE